MVLGISVIFSTAVPCVTDDGFFIGSAILHWQLAGSMWATKQPLMCGGLIFMAQ